MLPFRRFEASCEGRNRRRIEDVLEREIDVKAFPQTRKHLRHRKGIGTERENVLVNADLIKLQQIRPDVRQLRLQFRARRRRPGVSVGRRLSLLKARRGSALLLIFPLAPLGISGTIRIRPGTLNPARRFRAKSRSLCVLTLEFGRNTTTAATFSPSLLCGIANAPASTTSGWLNNASSTSTGETCCPPRLMTSLMRPTMKRYPSGSRYPRSPVRNQPFRKANSVAATSLSYPLRDRGSSQHDLSTFAGRQPSAFAVHDRDLGTGGLADRTGLASLPRICSDLGGGFRHAVGLDHGNAEQGFQPVEHVRAAATLKPNE